MADVKDEPPSKKRRGQHDEAARQLSVLVGMQVNTLTHAMQYLTVRGQVPVQLASFDLHRKLQSMTRNVPVLELTFRDALVWDTIDSSISNLFEDLKQGPTPRTFFESVQNQLANVERFRVREIPRFLQERPALAWLKGLKSSRLKEVSIRPYDPFYPSRGAANFDFPDSWNEFLNSWELLQQLALPSMPAGMIRDVTTIWGQLTDLELGSVWEDDWIQCMSSHTATQLRSLNLLGGTTIRAEQAVNYWTALMKFAPNLTKLAISGGFEVGTRDMAPYAAFERWIQSTGGRLVELILPNPSMLRDVGPAAFFSSLFRDLPVLERDSQLDPQRLRVMREEEWITMFQHATIDPPDSDAFWRDLFQSKRAIAERVEIELGLVPLIRRLRPYAKTDLQRYYIQQLETAIDARGDDLTLLNRYLEGIYIQHWIWRSILNAATNLQKLEAFVDWRSGGIGFDEKSKYSLDGLFQAAPNLHIFRTPAASCPVTYLYRAWAKYAPNLRLLDTGHNWREEMLATVPPPVDSIQDRQLVWNRCWKLPGSSQFYAESVDAKSPKPLRWLSNIEGFDAVRSITSFMTAGVLRDLRVVILRSTQFELGRPDLPPMEFTPEFFHALAELRQLTVVQLSGIGTCPNKAIETMAVQCPNLRIVQIGLYNTTDPDEKSACDVTLDTIQRMLHRCTELRILSLCGQTFTYEQDRYFTPVRLPIDIGKAANRFDFILRRTAIEFYPSGIHPVYVSAHGRAVHLPFGFSKDQLRVGGWEVTTAQLDFFV